MSIRLGNNIVAGRSPYQPSLFDFKWADHILTDPQWVRADTNLWHNRSVFTPAYDHLLADIQGKEAQSETIEGIIITYYLASDGHKICLSDQENYLNALYEKTGIAWYYMIDTTTQSFKVPRSKWNVVGIRSGIHDAAGKFETFALPNAASEGTAKTAASQMYLYFYIGNFTQTAIENTAGANLTDIENVMDESTTAIQNIVSEGIEAIDTAMTDLDTMINAQYHPNIFESKWSDHILNDIQWLRGDTFSWQSGEVYETAYNHLVDDVQNSSIQKQIYVNHNVTTMGNVAVNENGILSGFAGTTSYGIGDGVFVPTTSFELVVKTTIPSSITDLQNIISCDPTINYTGMLLRVASTTSIKIWLSSNGTSWNIADGTAFTCDTIPAGSTVWLKVTWNGTIYTIFISKDGIDYINIGTITNSSSINFSTGKFTLGGYVLNERPLTGGSIDLKESYIKIDDQVVWKGANFITYTEAEDSHKIVNANQAEYVNYIYNKTGIAWYYILDQENTRFKLPRKRSTQIVKSYKGDDGSWYKLYADGWVEQGGINTITQTTIILPVPMANTTYSGQITCNQGGSFFYAFVTKATTSITIRSHNKDNTQALSSAMWQVSGMSAIDMSKYQADEKYLYFYVGKFLQSAVVNTAGLNAELFNGKADIDAVVAKGHEVIEFQAPTSTNNYTWYRKYADGWVEMGGLITANSDAAYVQNLPITMMDTNYTVFITRKLTGDYSTNINARWQEVYNVTTTSFTTWGKYASYTQVYWEVKGMYA